MQPLASSQPAQGKLAYKWVVAIVVVFGAFVSILDQTIVNNALPALQTAFHVDLNNIQWIVTAYTLTQGVITPTTAFFADRLGYKRFYILALALFTIGSGLCGLAWDLPSMIVFRIIQGIGGAVLFPIAISLLFREFPPQQRGMASALIGMASLTAPAAGPTLGGYFVTYASWQLIFFVNLPIGLLGVLMAIFFLREVRSGERQKFDLIGFVLVACGLASLLYALSEATTAGWGSGIVLGFMITGLALLLIFLVVEMRRRQPLLELRLFRYFSFSITSMANALVGFSFFGSMILLPIYLQTLMRMDAFVSGLLTLPLAATSIAASFLGGRLIDRFGPRLVLIPGILITSLSTWLMAEADLATSYQALLWIMAIRGVGLGFLFQPLNVMALAEIPPRQMAQASSMNSVIRFVFTSFGIAVLATVVQTQATSHVTNLFQEQHPTTAVLKQALSQQGLQMSVHDALWISFWVLLAAGLLACFVRTPKLSPAKQEAVMEENAQPIMAFE